MQKSVQKRKERSIPYAVMLGAVTSLVITVVCMVLCTQLLNTSAITENALSGICPVIWFIASCIGCIISSAVAMKQFLVVCMISVAVYLAILFGLSVMFMDGDYGAIGWGILSAFAGTIPALLMFLKKNNTKKSKIKFRSL